MLLLQASGQRYRGRAMGVRMLAIYSLPIGLLSAGGLIGYIGLPPTVMLYAVIGLAFTIVTDNFSARAGRRNFAFFKNRMCFGSF